MDPRSALADGLVAVDDTVTVERLFEAYSFGIFPWPQEGFPTLWFSPPERGILEFNKYKISKSFKKFLNKNTFQVTFNQCFKDVILECRKADRPDQTGTWITEKILNSYIEFHQQGYAHSVEAWSDDGELVGGLYGVYVGGVFCGESMFYKHANASKLCLHLLIEKLKLNGKSWMDVQMVTPLLQSLGAEYISRDKYLLRLETEKKTAKPIQF
ncbi:MAG: leucyl/phenylalanyl-tRNA--protein transferase [Bdellovibrionales bacterium]|nr:leucyl/phenylalanyl-tRNA--protein transferase [Bdellovibrionales bacterium]